MNHAASEYGNLSAVVFRLVDDLLHPVYIGRKRSNNDAPSLCTLEQLFKAAAYGALGTSETGALCVGGVCHQRQHPTASQLAEPCQVDDLIVNGRKVYLKVAGMDDDACRCMDCHAHCAGDGVVHLNEFHRHAAHLYGGAWFDLD